MPDACCGTCTHRSRVKKRSVFLAAPSRRSSPSRRSRPASAFFLSPRLLLEMTPVSTSAAFMR